MEVKLLKYLWVVILVGSLAVEVDASWWLLNYSSTRQYIGTPFDGPYNSGGLGINLNTSSSCVCSNFTALKTGNLASGCVYVSTTYDGCDLDIGIKQKYSDTVYIVAGEMPTKSVASSTFYCATFNATYAVTAGSKYTYCICGRGTGDCVSGSTYTTAYGMQGDQANTPYAPNYQYDPNYKFYYKDYNDAGWSQITYGYIGVIRYSGYRERYDYFGSPYAGVAAALIDAIGEGSGGELMITNGSNVNVTGIITAVGRESSSSLFYGNVIIRNNTGSILFTAGIHNKSIRASSTGINDYYPITNGLTLYNGSTYEIFYNITYCPGGAGMYVNYISSSSPVVNATFGGGVDVTTSIQNNWTGYWVGLTLDSMSTSKTRYNSDVYMMLNITKYYPPTTTTTTTTTTSTTTTSLPPSFDMLPRCNINMTGYSVLDTSHINPNGNATSNAGTPSRSFNKCYCADFITTSRGWVKKDKSALDVVRETKQAIRSDGSIDHSMLDKDYSGGVNGTFNLMVGITANSQAILELEENFSQDMLGSEERVSNLEEGVNNLITALAGLGIVGSCALAYKLKK